MHDFMETWKSEMRDQSKMMIGECFYIDDRSKYRPHESNETCYFCQPVVLPMSQGSQSSLLSSSAPVSQVQPSYSQTMSKSATPTQVVPAKQGFSPVYPGAE